jgi:uncharacterized protein YecT (DUF1311 family)
MKYLVLLLLLFVPNLLTAQCKDAVSTKDMQDCMDDEWKKSDAELNRVYQESLKKLKPEQAALLKKAQRPGSPIATLNATQTTKCSREAPPLP